MDKKSKMGATGFAHPNKHIAESVGVFCTWCMAGLPILWFWLYSVLFLDVAEGRQGLLVLVVAFATLGSLLVGSYLLTWLFYENRRNKGVAWKLRAPYLAAKAAVAVLILSVVPLGVCAVVNEVGAVLWALGLFSAILLLEIYAGALDDKMATPRRAMIYKAQQKAYGNVV